MHTVDSTHHETQGTSYDSAAERVSTADNTTVTEMRINSHHNIIHNSIHTYAINAPVLSSAETFFNAYTAVLIPTIFNHIDKLFLLT